MKAMLEFDFHEEQEQYKAAVCGVNLLQVLRELDQEMRSILKYGDAKADQDQLEKWRGQINSVLTLIDF